MSRVERSDFRLPVFVIHNSINEVLRRPLESAQYLSIRYIERLAEAGIDTSGGSGGESYDHALTESIIGLVNTEAIKSLGPWKSVGRLEWENLKWVDWFNKERLLESLGYITPIEAEERYEQTLKSDKVVT